MSYDPVAFADTQWSEMLCAFHGEERNESIKAHCEADGCDGEECQLAPFHNWDDLDPVQYCGHGHSFCGCCGSDLDESSQHGNFWRCSNCNTFSVFTEENGNRWVNGFESTTDDLVVNVDLDNGFMRTAGTVLDESSVPMHLTRFFCSIREHSPIDGAVLVLADNWGKAHEASCDHFVEADENVENEAHEADIRSDVITYEVPAGAVSFVTREAVR